MFGLQPIKIETAAKEVKKVENWTDIGIVARLLVMQIHSVSYQH